MKKYLPLAVLLLGAAAILLLLFTRSAPDMAPPGETKHLAWAIVAEPMTVAPWATAYGEVAPGRTWAAVSQVSGKVVWKADRLKNGDFAREGDELLRIDDQEYRLAVSRNRAEIEKINARIRELESNRESMRQQVELLTEAVRYNERELRRQQSLYEQKAVSASAVEQQEIAMLDQQRSLASLLSSFEAMPAQIAYQRAELDAARANLATAELDLTRTAIAAPFSGRVDAASVETDQYVPAGQTLLELDSVDKAEIAVGVSPAKLAMLAGTRVEQVVEGITERRARPDLRPMFRILQDVGNGNHIAWDGRFGRMAASVDPTTRMVELVVEVDRPYRRSGPGETPHPPLSKGSFTTVVMHGRAQPGCLVVPRRAIHEGNLYIADAESRLEIRPVTLHYQLDKYAVVETGLAAGDVVVTSDLMPAVPGMLLEVRLEEDFRSRADAEIGLANPDRPSRPQPPEAEAPDPGPGRDAEEGADA